MHEKLFGKANELLDKIGLSTYFIFLVVALIALVSYFIYALEKKNEFSREKTNKLLIFFAIALGATYLFAYVFDAFFHYLETGVFFGGVTYIAGFLGGLITFSLLLKFIEKMSFKEVINILNIIIPGVILAHAIGRVGCFSVGCCYGKPTDSIFGVVFPEGTNAYIEGMRGKLHPTQLYETFFLLGLFFVLKIKQIKNYRLSIYLMSYGVFRFILEVFFRADSRGVLFGLAPSVILSIVMFLMGISLLIYDLYFKKKKEEVNDESLLWN